MKTAMPFILVIGLLVTRTCSSYAQHAETLDILEGKWKLEMQRDTMGNAIDIGYTRDPELEPDIYTTIDIKNKKKAILAAGNTTITTSWELNGKLLNFYLRKKDIWVAYPIKSLNSSAMVLVFTVGTEDGPMKVEVYYKKM